MIPDMWCGPSPPNRRPPSKGNREGCLNAPLFVEKTLEPAEWFLVGTLALLLVTFFLIARISTARATPLDMTPLSKVCLQKRVQVTISGAVKKPGVYSVPVGTSLRDALKKSCPLRFANLRTLDLAQRVEQSIEVVIAELSEIQVRAQLVPPPSFVATSVQEVPAPQPQSQPPPQIPQTQPLQEGGRAFAQNEGPAIPSIPGYSMEWTVPVRTRVCDLRSKIPSEWEVDSQSLKSRRMLRDGEILFLSQKKSCEKKEAPAMIDSDILQSPSHEAENVCHPLEG